ncbi:MAG: C40 family peptidase [Bacteroidetes bacterium]|nr:C40 family peptidase [Bacteroidota bacterium]MBS1930708.1 C40 family peptidase [Bacteroidota bacterium]
MVKKLFPAISLILLLGSCSALKQIDISSNKQIVPTTSTATVHDTQLKKTKDVKFLNDISASNSQADINSTPKNQPRIRESEETVNSKSAKQPEPSKEIVRNENNLESDNASMTAALQEKYAAKMNIDPSDIQNLKLYEYIDDWYGTRYRLGGTSKDGIDCSAFVQSLFATVYGISLPRTSKYQYTATKRISTTQLKEGDLLFFHTRKYHKGVTHVGIYLQNNKFVQASSSGGVTVSDMYDPYYVKHLIGAGRVVSDN